MTQADKTRLSLLSRARRHDAQAWRELVDLYGPLIAHWCTKCSLSSHQSADVIQEVFASVSRSLDTYQARKENGSFRSWLWTITGNKVKDFFRRNANQGFATGGSTALAQLEQIPETAEQSLVPDEEPTGESEITALVQRGLVQVRSEFEARTWRIFQRSVVDEIPTAVVAEEFEVTPAAVRQSRSRVLRRLRQQLGDIEF